MGSLQGRTVANQETAGPVGEKEALVWVEGDGVCATQAPQPVPAALGEHEEPSVGTVDVEPEALLFG